MQVEPMKFAALGLDEGFGCPGLYVGVILVIAVLGAFPIQAGLGPGFDALEKIFLSPALEHAVGHHDCQVASGW
jgi:hypothetical protein